MSSTGAVTVATLGSSLAAEMEHEGIATRQILERIPAEKFDWKPHPKSMAFGRLACHVAEMFGWTGPTLTQPELNFATMDYKPLEPQTTEDLLEYFDTTISEALDVLRATPDETFMENWSLKNGETVYFTLPKAGVMRSFVMNHIIHHRGQLTVYLRLNDIAVPAVYGPSADEGSM